MRIETPHRAAHTYTQRLVGTPEAVFPLLCPVREVDWVDGWDPRLVVSASGVAERDCAFVTGPPENEAVWYITECEPPRHIEFIKITPAETAARIVIDLRPGPEGDCLADVTYAHTALTPRGEAFVDDFTPEFYDRFMKGWERALNHYLETGTKLAE